MVEGPFTLFHRVLEFLACVEADRVGLSRALGKIIFLAPLKSPPISRYAGYGILFRQPR